MTSSALMVAAVAAGLNLFGAIRAVTPDMYGGKTNAWQLARHRAKMEVVTNGGSKVVFIGDSITHFWESHGKRQWAKYFEGEPYKALNLGISGDRTEHVLWRITEGKELDGYEAKCILLMIGTNNTGHHTFEEEPPADTILGIRAILETIRAKQPTAKIVLTAIFPRGRDFRDQRRRRNEIVNKEIAKFADGKTIFWCDFNDQLLTPDGVLPCEVMPDRLHPREYGYEVWAAAVKPYIDYALSDGKLPAPPNRYAPFARNACFQVDESRATYPATWRNFMGGGDAWWGNRLLRNRNQIADSDGKIDLVFLGDSITHNGESQGSASLEELRKTYSVLNLGYGGDCTANLIWRCENGELDGYEATCAMVMIGTNNGEEPGEVAKGVRRVLDILAKKQPQAKVLLLPIFPRGENAGYKRRKRNEAVNAEIVKFADGEKVIWVDFNAKFLDEKGDTKWCMPDRLHPNAEAYKNIWLPSVLPYFQKICGK